MRNKDDTYVNDGGGGRSSYSRSLENSNSSYQKALSKATKKRIKNGVHEGASPFAPNGIYVGADGKTTFQYRPNARYNVGTWDDETEDYYLKGKRISYSTPQQAVNGSVGAWTRRLKSVVGDSPSETASKKKMAKQVGTKPGEGIRKNNNSYRRSYAKAMEK